jgi:hypothetical protein
MCMCGSKSQDRCLTPDACGDEDAVELRSVCGQASSAVVIAEGKVQHTLELR